jgi:toxin-antitoxin system PIN domain toxin
VILIDANILVYAVSADLPQHTAAKAWLDERLTGVARVGLPWASLLAFLRLMTNARIFDRPIRMADGWSIIEAWLAVDGVWVPSPTDRHAQVLSSLLAIPGLTSRLVPDAHLAALAIEHGLELCSADADFARFAGLRWSNPLAA